MRLFDFFKRLFDRTRSTSTQNKRTSPAPLQKMLAQIANTQDIELSCDEVLTLMDQFAEAYLRGEDVASMMPLVQHHLDTCPDCREEYEALLRILRATAD